VGRKLWNWDNGPSYGHLLNYMENYRSQTNHYGFLWGIDVSEANHDDSSLLYIGHHQFQDGQGDPNHYGFFMSGYGQWLGEGSTVPAIWDYDVRDHAQDNHKFVFLWVCRNGNERGDDNSPPYSPSGMPNCWTGNQIGPGNGIPTFRWYEGGTGDAYYDPDGSGYCLISFFGASPMLSYPLDLSRPNQLHKHWLEFFYFFALHQDYQGLNDFTVNQALEYASIYAGYYGGFSQTSLYQGGLTWWAGGDGQEEGGKPSQIRLFGDGNIILPGNIFTGGGPLG
jgi:hypothetical protein